MITQNKIYPVSFSCCIFKLYCQGYLHSSGAMHLYSWHTPSPGQSLLSEHSFFSQPIFSSNGFPKYPSGQVQNGRCWLGLQTAFLPQITGPSQTFMHSLCPNAKALILQDSVSSHWSLLLHFSAGAQTPPLHSWKLGQSLFLLHFGTHCSFTQTWLVKQSRTDLQGAIIDR